MEFVSERRSCQLFNISRSVYRQKTIIKDIDLKKKIMEIAMKRTRFGYRRINDILNKEMKINHKKTYRLYCELNLKYRRKKTKKRHVGEPIPIQKPSEANIRWSMDFVSDSLYNGRKFRVFNLIDDYSRESIVQYVDFSISGARLTRLFDELKLKRMLPKQLVCDNGTEFTSKAFRKWAAENGIEIHYIDKGKPMQNGFVESFNGKFRDECLDAEWFESLNHAREIVESWRFDYNSNRPHSGLNGLSPFEFLKQIA